MRFLACRRSRRHRGARRCNRSCVAKFDLVLDEGAFEDLDTTQGTFTGNQISTIPSAFRRSIKCEVDLGNLQIRTIEADAFVGITNVNVDLSSNYITSVHPFSFRVRLSTCKCNKLCERLRMGRHAQPARHREGPQEERTHDASSFASRTNPDLPREKRAASSAVVFPQAQRS